jgi:hypothetical protein
MYYTHYTVLHIYFTAHGISHLYTAPAIILISVQHNTAQCCTVYSARTGAVLCCAAQCTVAPVQRSVMCSTRYIKDQFLGD